MEFFPGLFMPADREHWLERMLAGTQAFEEVLGVTLATAHGGTKMHATTEAITDRRRYFAKRLETKNRWWSLFCGQGIQPTPEGPRNLDYFCIGGTLYADADLFRLSVLTPPLSADVSERLLVAIGDAFGIESAQFTPEPAARRLRLAHWCIRIGEKEFPHPLSDRTAAESRLPKIYESTYSGLPPGKPHHFGWLNYWSESICRANGLEDDAAAMPMQSYRTPRGARLVKLRDRPPQAVDDDYAERLRAAYAAHPGVGVR